MMTREDSKKTMCVVFAVMAVCLVGLALTYVGFHVG